MSNAPSLAARLTLCGSISLYPVSLGSSMHLAGYRALGLPFTYVPFRVTDLAGAITGMRALGIRGLGISMPYKQEIMPLLDAIDAQAAQIGAVNTVVRGEDGRLRGYNTDAVGAVRALEEVRAIQGARVLLLGAGGAARAIAHGLAGAGASLVLANRTREKAEAIAQGIEGASVRGLDEALSASDWDVLVNATSKGMLDVDPGSPVPEEAIRPGTVVMDIVYKPIETELLRAAERRGARTIHGGRMLLHQAARQFELYTGVAAPLEAMDAALREQISLLAPAR
ncbi:shikimate dehydrogenase [Polyangium aurulentum]|uniref:shikimate dehydrogenase n=1 Tax=Polyangium aurulentum TaxID=2567896 RepID=UPI001F16BB90|nr:shikimate dehydrogenase [Polyangium aurulentum]